MYSELGKPKLRNNTNTIITFSRVLPDAHSTVDKRLPSQL